MGPILCPLKWAALPTAEPHRPGHGVAHSGRVSFPQASLSWAQWILQPSRGSPPPFPKSSSPPQIRDLPPVCILPHTDLELSIHYGLDFSTTSAMWSRVRNPAPEKRIRPWEPSLDLSTWLGSKCNRSELKKLRSRRGNKFSYFSLGWIQWRLKTTPCSLLKSRILPFRGIGPGPKVGGIPLWIYRREGRDIFSQGFALHQVWTIVTNQMFAQ